MIGRRGGVAMIGGEMVGGLGNRWRGFDGVRGRIRLGRSVGRSGRSARAHVRRIFKDFTRGLRSIRSGRIGGETHKISLTIIKANIAAR